MPRKKKTDEAPLKASERAANAEGDATQDLAVPVENVESGQLVDTELVDSPAVEQMTDTDPVVAAEEAAVHTDTESAREASGDAVATDEEPAAPKPAVTRAPKVRSAKYQTAAAAVEGRKYYALARAIELVKETSYTKFDGTVELHVRLAPRKKAESDSIRGLLQLPHGTGKTVNAVILTEELVDQIATSGKVSADILIATPALMPKVAKIAKILGPQGKMPSPKAGTVSDTPEDALAALQSGRVEYRADKGGIIHQAIGKVSWDGAKLEENARAVLGALAGYQLLSVNLSATMGPGVRVDTSDR